MYRDELDAARARIAALEADLELAQARNQTLSAKVIAAEAERAEALASVRQRQGLVNAGAQHTARRRALRTGAAVLVALLTALGVAALYGGASHRRCAREARLRAQLSRAALAAGGATSTSAATGEVAVHAQPAARVYLGQRWLGWTPVTVRLPTGRHSLRLVGPAGAERRADVQVSADRTSTVSVAFAPRCERPAGDCVEGS